MPTIEEIQNKLKGYESEEYNQGSSYAIAQWLNVEKGGGLLITEENIQLANLDIATAEGNDWQKVDPKWDGVKFALASTKPVISLIRKGQPFIIDGKTSEYVGTFDDTDYDQAIHSVKSRVVIAILHRVEDAYICPHNKPIVLSTRGSVGASLTGKNGVFRQHAKAVSTHIGRETPPWAFATHLTCNWEEVGQGKNTSNVWKPYGYSKLLSNEDGILQSCYVGDAMLDILQEFYVETKDFDKMRSRKSKLAQSNGKPDRNDDEFYELDNAGQKAPHDMDDIPF